MTTDFINGVTSYGVPVLGPGTGFGPGTLPLISTGNHYWFVSSVSGSNGFNGSFIQPFATLAYAATYPNVLAGDVIVVLAGHTETIITDGGIVIPSGVRVVGIGNGLARPTFTFGTAANASIQFANGGNASIDNIIGLTTVASTLARPITLSANNSGTTVSNFTWKDQVGFEANHVFSATSVTDLTIDSYHHEGLANGTIETSAILLNNCAEVLIRNIDYWGNNSVAAVNFVTAKSRNVRVDGKMWVNGVSTSVQLVVDTVTGSTWEASIYDGYAGQWVQGSSATGNGSLGTFTPISGAYIPVFPASTPASNGATTAAVLGYAVNMLEKTVQTGNAVSLNAIANTTLFTVAGGPILIEDLVGVSLASGTSPNGQLSFAVTSGTPANVNTALCTPNANQTTFPAGQMYSLPAAVASNTVVSTNGVFISVAPAGGIVAPVGNVYVSVAVAAITGAYQFYMRYKPLAVSSLVANSV